MSPALPTAVKVTVKVIARHRPDCPYKKLGITKAECPKCVCPKAVYVYQSGQPDKRMSAKTTEWAVAQRRADQIERQFNPELAELDQRRAQEKAKQIPIADAIGQYIANMIRRLGDNGTVAMARSLFGQVDAQSKTAIKKGQMLNWLDTIPTDERPAFIADITTPNLTAWRASWKFGDYTAAQRWGMVKSFFNFCERQGWIQDSPARKLERIQYDKGSRTAIFTDDQYAAILAAIPNYEPENVPAVTRASWQQRVLTFTELLRWSGMALIDAVQWRPDWVDDEGVLQYRRQKTRKHNAIATVQLPQHVIALLRSVPLEKDSVGPDQPFRTKGFTAHSDTETWRKRLMKLFVLAGIKTVRNELGVEKNAHPHMLRDTFAVWQLLHGVPVHDVSRALGHTNISTTEKHYLPFVKERRQATIANQRKALAAAKPKTTGRNVVNMVNRQTL